MRDITQEDTFNGYPLKFSRSNNQGFYEEILQANKELMDYMTQKHGKVFFTIFGLNYPANSGSTYPNDNSLLKQFLDTLNRQCLRSHYDPKYLWVRETSSTGQPHYHLMLLMDSNYVQEAFGLRDYATGLWGNHLGIANAKGLVHLYESEFNDDPYGGVKIINKARDFQQVYGRCFYRASYLAKVYSKRDFPPHVKGYGRSQLS